MSDELMELPEGWVWKPFEELVVNHDGRRIPVSSTDRQQRQGDFPYYGASGIIDYVDAYLFDGDYLLIAEDGANLISRSTPIAFEATGKFWVNNHAHILQPVREIILTSYLQDYFNFTDLRFYISGSAQPKLNQKNLNRIPIPLPPLNEQKRIVAKIEELRERSQKARSHLSAIPNLCDKFRQSVLAAAFRGDLTADWREQNPDVEPASVLLERIRRDGQQRSIRKKTNLGELDLSTLPEIPETWKWEQLIKISGLLGGVTKGRKFNGQVTVQVPYLRVANVQDGFLDLEEIKEIEVLPEDINKYRLEHGDILFTEGGDRDKLGRGTVWRNEIAGCIHQNHVYRSRLCSSEMLPEYVSLAAKSKYAKDYFFHNASQTVNLASINMTTLGKLPLPIPPTDEQKEICSIVYKLFEIAEIIKTNHSKLFHQLDQLDRSILAKAFRGELVEQDPNDEPASVLLERIRAEREQQAQGKAKKPGKKGQRTIKTDPP